MGLGVPLFCLQCLQTAAAPFASHRLESDRWAAGANAFASLRWAQRLFAAWLCTLIPFCPSWCCYWRKKTPQQRDAPSLAAVELKENFLNQERGFFPSWQLKRPSLQFRVVLPKWTQHHGTLLNAVFSCNSLLWCRHLHLAGALISPRG